MKFMLIRLVMVIIWISACYKWGDWKNWRKYYPTMLFFGMGDLIYTAVFHNKILWQFQTKVLVPPINELFVIFGIFFPTTLLFLSKFPKNLYHQVLYIGLWVALYMLIEIFATSLEMQKNYNGWSIYWSLLHNVIQFPLVALHHKKPIAAWIIALIFLTIIMKTFNVPFIIPK